MRLSRFWLTTQKENLDKWRDNEAISDDEFKAGHLVGSIHLLPSEIKANNVHQIDKYKDRPVILLDANGFSATKSAELLTKQGFNQVYVLKEGMVGWKAENLPTVKKK